MITVKQVLEHYNIVTEKASNDTKNLAALVHAGLLDESKLPILNRALSKPVTMMTEAEKKALQEFVESLASCVISEQQDFLSKMDTSRPMEYPSDKNIPTVLILKRKAIRVYPDNQKVALYYNTKINKYFSVPYGVGVDANIQAENTDAGINSINEDVMSQLQKIKDTHQHGSVKHSDGTSSKIDVNTAHAILTVHKHLNDENKKKFADMVGKSQHHLQKAAEFSWKSMKW